MTMTLDDLAACFEGVIPSILATAAAGGEPNISYLSHVAVVDDRRVAISNQFFAKTAANIRANPHASLLLVDGRSGRQYRLDLLWEKSVDRGDLFDRMSHDLRVSSAEVGLDDVMRLRAIDIFRVLDIAPCPSPEEEPGQGPETGAAPLSLVRLSAQLARIGAEATVEGLIDTLVDVACAVSGTGHAMVAIHDAAQDRLVIAGSAGYDRSGAGSEIMPGSSLIGEAAHAARTLKHSDLSRVRRLAAAAAELDNEDRSRHIALPLLRDALSQIAVPMMAQGRLMGVLFAESRQRLAFDRDAQAALEAIALQAAATFALLEGAEREWGREGGHDGMAHPSPVLPPPDSARIGHDGPEIRIVTYAYDDSLFIDGRYIIKGLAGRLLVFLVETALAEQRADFTNREIRLATQLRLPDIKDNLETRLLLLRRRLEERDAPIRMVRTERGRMRLAIHGRPIVEHRP